MGCACGGVRCSVVSESGVYKSDACYEFIVSNGVQPLGGGEVEDLSNPDVFPKLANGGVERGEPRGKEPGFVAPGDAAANDKVGARVSPSMGVENVQYLFNGFVTVEELIKLAMSV